MQVEATGLKPFTTYNYQFKICGTDTASPVGRTKTAPTADDYVSEISLAVFSCSNYREYPPRAPSRETTRVAPDTMRPATSGLADLRRVRRAWLAANGYFNAYGNAARKDEHDYAVSISKPVQHCRPKAADCAGQL